MPLVGSWAHCQGRGLTENAACRCVCGGRPTMQGKARAAPTVQIPRYTDYRSYAAAAVRLTSTRARALAVFSVVEWCLLAAEAPAPAPLAATASACRVTRTMSFQDWTSQHHRLQLTFKRAAPSRRSIAGARSSGLMLLAAAGCVWYAVRHCAFEAEHGAPATKPMQHPTTPVHRKARPRSTGRRRQREQPAVHTAHGSRRVTGRQGELHRARYRALPKPSEQAMQLAARMLLEQGPGQDRVIVLHG